MRTSDLFEVVEPMAPVDRRQAIHAGLGDQINSAGAVAEPAACSSQYSWQT